MLKSIFQSKKSEAQAKLNLKARQIASKTKVKYALVYILCFALPCAVFYFQNIQYKIGPTYLYIMLQILALIAGVVHVWQMGKRFNWTNESSFTFKLSLTLWIVFICMLLQCLIIYGSSFFNEYNADRALLFPTYFLTFAFPLLTITIFDLMVAVPTPIYKMWKYPTNVNIPDLDMIDFSNSQIVTFTFKKNARDEKNTSMKFKAPQDKLAFGDLFFLYLYEYNEKNRESQIQYLNELNQTYEWLFYIKSNNWFNDKMYIDTSLTFRENKIKENDVIIAERVS